MISVANAQDLGPVEQWPRNYVYVGRAVPRRGFKASPLANPYHVGGQYEVRSGVPPLRIQFGRRECVAYYEPWLIEQLNASICHTQVEFGRLLRMAGEGDLVLVCWCHPKRCHADTIKRLLEADIS